MLSDGVTNGVIEVYQVDFNAFLFFVEREN